MARNVIKQTIHKWRSNILSIHENSLKCEMNITFFSSKFGGPTYEEGVCWLGQMPNFFRKFLVLQTLPLSIISNQSLALKNAHCLTDELTVS